MGLARFKTVRGRLLALLMALSVPIAGLTGVAAWANYRTVHRAIEHGQLRAAEDFSIRTRVWYRGALRTLLGSATAIAHHADEAECSALGRTMLQQLTGFEALYVRYGGGRQCAASIGSGIAAPELSKIAQAQKDRPTVRVWAGQDVAGVRYDRIEFASRTALSVYVRDAQAPDGGTEALALIDPALLSQTFDLGDEDPGLSVSLVSRGGIVVTSRTTGEEARTWLPAVEKIPEKATRWTAPSVDGVSRTHVARLVVEPDMYVVASFDARPERAAWRQFLALLIAPWLMLLALGIVYVRAIDGHCVRWLRGIEGAVRRRSSASPTRAPVTDEMPDDIRNVSTAFNEMMEEQEVRQRNLQTALDDNRFLVRELHHRVKNSLQVVQSYIGLTKRDYRNEARRALADAECHVHVLSAAYRFTLADGEMQPVRIDVFIEDVVTMISNLLRARDQWVGAQIETRALLPVDRLIPLGFLVVDIVARALRDNPGAQISVKAMDVDAHSFEIAVTADRPVVHSQPPKLFAGLLAQIEATVAMPPEGRELGAWRIRHYA